MRLAASIVCVAGALIATPSIAASTYNSTTYNSSWEGQVTEAQKKGPYARVRGPNRNGGYTVSGPNRQDRPLWQYRWDPVR